MGGDEVGEDARLMVGNIGVEWSCSYGCLGEAWCISISDSHAGNRENYICNREREREKDTRRIAAATSDRSDESVLANSIIRRSMRAWIFQRRLIRFRTRARKKIPATLVGYAFFFYRTESDAIWKRNRTPVEIKVNACNVRATPAGGMN